MKNTIKLAFIALGFVAFTTSCDNAGKTAENATESVENTANEATTPQEGDTAVVIEQDADAMIKTDTTVTTETK